MNEGVTHLPVQNPQVQARHTVAALDMQPATHWHKVALGAVIAAVAMGGAGWVGYEMGRQAVSTSSRKAIQTLHPGNDNAGPAFRVSASSEPHAYGRYAPLEGLNVRSCRDVAAESISRVLAEMEWVSDHLASLDDQRHASMGYPSNDYFDLDLKDIEFHSRESTPSPPPKQLDGTL